MYFPLPVYSLRLRSFHSNNKLLVITDSLLLLINKLNKQINILWWGFIIWMVAMTIIAQLFQKGWNRPWGPWLGG